MKFLLLAFCLFLICFNLHAGEKRLTGFHRRGETVEWLDNTSEFFGGKSGLSRHGTLTVSRVTPLDSVHPYDFEAGRHVNRAGILDDLFYESLLLADPIASNEKMYPLLARALRVDDELSYVIFEIDPRARFQDGTEVKASDVLFSLEVLKNSSPALKDKLEAVIQSTHATDLEVRIDLKTRGQSSRDAIMLLASVKIVKDNSTGAKEMSGIRTRFTPTGSYRLTQLGRTRMALIIDPAYWAKDLSVRRGFFNFRVIEVISFGDETSARMALATEHANFYAEKSTAGAQGFAQTLRRENENIRLVEERVSPAGESIPTLSFNTQSPVVGDPRVRQAILLAYDFHSINVAYFAGALRRPLGILDDSPVGPEGLPAKEVQSLIDTCGIPAPGLFESHGHAQHKSVADKRLRLFTATRLLQESGFKLENGVLHRSLGENRYAPVQLKLLVRNGEQRGAHILRSDLLRLGIETTVTAADGPAFRMLAGQGAYDLITSQESFADKEGWPNGNKLESEGLKQIPCVRQMLSTMDKEDPAGDTYLDNAEAIARIHAALHLSIYTGSPSRRSFYLDQRLHVPAGLSAQNIHMYGYWREQEAAAVDWSPAFPFDHHTFDFGDMIGK